MGTVSQVVDGGGIILQEIPDELGRSIQFRVELFYQLFAIAILKLPNNLFVLCSSTDST
jgi:hypothetical protein